MPYRNPVVPGFFPDPSVCRVGEDYYLVCSSFEYFPGVPIHHSRDLINWRPIGYCLTRESQLPLAGCASSRGIWAPTIRHHQGRFYMVTTNMTDNGHFYVHTEDPAGEWSEPIPLPGRGIDPSFFFDDDGVCYLTTNGEGMIIVPLDVKTGELLDSPRPFWRGMIFGEGPHLYKIGGVYYALLAEGGTEYGHMVTLARGNSPLGPWEPHPRNPIFSHRSTNGPIQATGHADLIQAHDGSWWMVFLGVRPVHYPRCHHLGRETFLAPVTWHEGWPVVNEGKLVTLQMDCPTLPQHPWPRPPARDDFAVAKLRLQWNFLRNPDAADWSLTQRPGFLRLRGSERTLDEPTQSPAFVGRRQQHFYCAATTLLEFNPIQEGEEAGLTVLMNERHHYEIAVRRQEGARQVLVRRRIGGLQVVTASQPLPASGPVTLQIRTEPKTYTFAYSCAGAGAGTGAGAEQPLVDLDTADVRYLATEAAGGFTGVYFGLYATGNGKRASAPADFDWFDYRQTQDDPTGVPR